MNYLNIIAGIVLSLVITAFYPATLLSYVLQGPHIIELMTEKLGKAESLFVSQRVIFYPVPPQSETLPEKNYTEGVGETAYLPDGSQAPMAEAVVRHIEPKTIQLDESLRYVFSDAFRSDIISDVNQRIYVANDGRSITVIDGVISDAAESRFDLYKDLLLYRTREALLKRLSHLGIDVNVSSLGKFEDQPALVVGAEFPDNTVSQVWFDKKNFRPLRLIIAGTNSLYSNSTANLEIRYLDWQPLGKIWYPMQIEFIQDGTTVRLIEVDDYQINPRFSKDVFDIARLKLEYRQPVTTSAPSGENEGLSEVQKTIDEFKKIFE